MHQIFRAEGGKHDRREERKMANETKKEGEGDFRYISLDFSVEF